MVFRTLQATLSGLTEHVPTVPNHLALNQFQALRQCGSEA